MVVWQGIGSIDDVTVSGGPGGHEAWVHGGWFFELVGALDLSDGPIKEVLVEACGAFEHVFHELDAGDVPRGDGLVSKHLDRYGLKGELF